ncbi:hypothetical protein QDG88_02920 [Pseudoalteromonas piscicida]|uniref:cyanobactin maturation protease PatG family protein n=1 Tax=Pseudoalteromonas piscicida TaxID=43662 RepID=UPI002739EBEA|nr:hypothetical protein [Pseudoalteromonas piscicida]MDP4486903.1 hypothetical protein [Pseudoalteromonas piscicida]
MNQSLSTQQNLPLSQRLANDETNSEPSVVFTNFVYAVGVINAQFPTLNLEKELYQNSLMGNQETQLPMLENVNDDIALQRLNRNKQLNQELFKGLSLGKNRYIARSMKWVLDNRYIEQLYTLLIPTDELLTQCITALDRTTNSETGQVVIIGEMHSPNTVLVSAIIPVMVLPFGEVLHGVKANNDQFQNLVTEITSLNISRGNSDATRALNYVLYNNPAIYQQSFHLYYQSRQDGPNPNGYQLINVDVNVSNSGDRVAADVIFVYQGINTGAMQFWRSRVDVTGEYPFVVSNWEQYLPSNHS